LNGIAKLFIRAVNTAHIQTFHEITQIFMFVIFGLFNDETVLLADQVPNSNC